jgi:hypothetical protein
MGFEQRHMGHAMMMGEGHKKVFHRHYFTNDEKKEWLENYIDQLRKELKAAEEKLKELE